MALIVSLLVYGSGMISLLISWQVKHVAPELGALARYNLIIIPLIFSANLALGTAFVRAHVVLKNLPFLVALQTFIYYLFLLVFSVLLVGEKISVARALLGFSLMVLGIWILKK